MVEETTIVVEDINSQSKLTSPTTPLQLSVIIAATPGIQLQNAQNLNSQLGNLAHVTSRREEMRQFHQQMPIRKVTQLYQQ